MNTKRRQNTAKQPGADALRLIVRLNQQPARPGGSSASAPVVFQSTNRQRVSMSRTKKGSGDRRLKSVVQKPEDHRGRPGWGWILPEARGLKRLNRTRPEVPQVLVTTANCRNSSLCCLMLQKIVHSRIGANLVNRLATNV